MANGSTSGGGNNGLLYGIIGALCVVVAGGGFYLFKMDRPVESPPQAAIPAPPAPPAAAPAAAPPPVAAPRPAPPPVQAGPTAAQIGQARNLIGDARRFASLGDFAGAETALQNADKAAPGLAEIAQARSAIARGDYATAERDLAQAEQIDANAPAVIEARRDLRAAERGSRPTDNRPQDTRVTLLVTAARAAILVGDLASADRALDQAEQIAPRDAAVVQARAELSAAQRTGRPARN